MAPGTSPHVPAWKKLGLKLKYARDEAPSPPVALGTNGTSNIKTNGSTSTEPPRKKRRFSDSDEPSFPPLPKLNGSEDSTLKKKVSFSSDTKTKDGDTARSANPPPTLIPHTNGTSTTTINEAQTAPQSDHPSKPKSKSKSKPKPKSTSKPKPSPPSTSTTKPKAGLSYLTTFYTSHSTWKFSKNHSTWLLKNALSESAIPRSFNFPLACYVHNLQSTAARERLKSECEKARLDSSSSSSSSEKATIDHTRIADFLSAIKLFTASPEDFKPTTPAVAWAEKQKRTDIIRWVLHPDGLHQPTSSDKTRKLDAQVEPAKSKGVPTMSASDVDQVSPVRRNRKSRTNITTADLSSSSSSSDTSSDDDNDDGKADEDDTSSSGSDSDSL